VYVLLLLRPVLLAPVFDELSVPGLGVATGWLGAMFVFVESIVLLGVFV
jgi:hypothetical protein